MKDLVMVDVQERLGIIKKDALDKLSIYLSVSILFLFIAFLLRLKDFDWQSLYYFHFLCFVIGTAVVVFNKRLSYKAIIYSYLAMGLVITYVEFMSLGISGMGELAALFCIMLSLFYLDKKSTILIGIIITALYAMAFFEYISARRSISDNDLAFVSLTSAWVGRFVSYTAFFAIIGMSIFHLQSQIIRLLEKVENHKNIIEEQKKFIEHLANHDALTGLLSLRDIDKRIEIAISEAQKNKYNSALLFLDLDGFKSINDSHGHNAGDEVLKSVAHRVLSTIRSSDTACRVGGDEFLIIVDKIRDGTDLKNLCERLVDTISNPFTYRGTELTIGVSIGAATYPSSATDATSLRVRADELMYQVKKSGKNNFLICDQNFKA
jgi:diguanylate cyclase (GGDEF)-like protein